MYFIFLGPQYENAKALKGENPYENTEIENNNPPNGKQVSSLVPYFSQCLLADT